MRILLWFLVVLFTSTAAAAQQPLTPCEEVRGIMATNMAELATQVRVLERENAALKTKLVELQKQKTETPK
jgi:hypothetical protein